MRIFAAFLICCALAGAAPHANRLPTWAAATDDAHTLGLFAFDTLAERSDAHAANSHPVGPAARLDGDWAAASGRFAGGLALRGDGALRTDAPTRNWTVSLQLRLDALPADAPRRLLRLSDGGRETGALTLSVQPDGRLRLDAYGLTTVSSADALPLRAQTWSHIALVGRAAYVDQRWQGDLELLIDGHPVIQLIGQPKLVNQRLESLELGGDALPLTIDDLHVSRAARAYYQYDLTWLTPNADPRLPLAAPYLRLGLATQAVDFDALLPTESTPGVHGAAARVGGGAAPPAVALGPRAPTSRQGSIAFWIRPLDWDNLKRDNQYDTVHPLRMDLLSLTAKSAGQTRELLGLGLFIEPSVKLPELIELTPGAWRHIAITWNGDQQQVYVDGQPSLGQGLVLTWPKADSAPPITADTLSWTSDSPASTAIDALILAERALAPPEIANLRARHDPRQTPVELPALHLESRLNPVLGSGDIRIWRLDGQADAATGTLRLQDAGGDSIYERDLAMADAGPELLPVTPGRLAFGDYQWQASLGELSGDSAFSHVAPPWWQTDIGEDPTVPPGWTPVALADDGAIEIVRRRLHLSPLGLPARVESAGGEILAAPMSLDLTVGGQPIDFSDKAPPTVTVESDARASWTADAASDAVRLQTAGSIAFDGMIWLELTLSPTDQPVTVDALTIRLPYAVGAASYHHWWSGDMKFAAGRTFRHPKNTNGGAALPAGEGQLFRSNDAETVGLPPELRGSFIPYLMLTGMQRGMAWFGESDRGWTQSTAVPAVSIERQGDRVELVLRVISEPVRLDGPRRVAFGLHPIPVKALPTDWRRRARLPIYPDAQFGNNLKGTKVEHFDLVPQDEDWLAMQARLTGVGSPDEGAGKMIAAAKARAADYADFWGRAPGPLDSPRPGIYWNQAWIGHFPPHTQPWAALWYRRAWVTYDPDFQDYAAWALDRWLAHADGQIGGVYMDDMWASPQLEGPLTYQLADGHVQPTWQWRAYRERYVRMRRIFLAHGVTPTLVAHQTNTYYMPYHSMFDIAYDGEFRYAKAPDQQTFLDRWPADRLRFVHHDKWGIVTTWLGWTGAEEANYRRDLPAWSYRQARAWVAALAQHDILWRFDVANVYDRPSPLHRQLGLRDPKTRFVPYWADSGLASHEHGDQLRVSGWRLADGSCLLLLVNHGDATLDATVRLSPAAMGFAADATLTARDVDPSLLAMADATATDVTTLQQPAEPTAGALDLTADDEPDAADALGGADLALDLDLAPGPAAATTAPTNPAAALTFSDYELHLPIRPDDFRLIHLSLTEEQP